MMKGRWRCNDNKVDPKFSYNLPCPKLLAPDSQSEIIKNENLPNTKHIARPQKYKLDIVRVNYSD